MANSRAFTKGLQNLKVKDAPEAKAAIAAVLGITTKQSFIRYAFGRVKNLDVEKAAKIERIFRAYGVKDCWGES